MIGGERQRRAAVVVGGRSGRYAHGGGQRVHVVRQERCGHGGLGVEVREPAGHHLVVVMMVAGGAVVQMAAVVAVVLLDPGDRGRGRGVPVGETGRGRAGRRGWLKVRLRRDGRHGGRRAPVAVR